MTDNEIIKALECCTSDGCTCRECPYEDTKHIVNEEFETMSNGKTYDAWSCDEWLKIDLLDLINRQKVEIERLKYNLKAVLDEKSDHSEAIKEFADRLKSLLTPYPNCWFKEPVTSTQIDDLVKEMTE